MQKETSDNVSVELLSFNNLSLEGYPLVLDNYQRAYVWGVDKVIQLLNDLLSFIQESEDEDAYYMGTLLLHKFSSCVSFMAIPDKYYLNSPIILAISFD